MTAGSGQFSGQRAQKPHLVRGTGGVAGEVADLRQDLQDDFVANAAIAVEEFTNPAAADVDAIKTSFASAATAQDFSGADLDGVVGTATMDPPRNVTITTSLHADIDAVPVTITGTDVDGNVLTEDITLTDGGGTTDAGASGFASVSRIQIPNQSGPGGAIEVGFGDIIGLHKPIKTMAGLTGLIREIEAGVVVTTATMTTPAVGAPNGTYLAATVPDGANDYAIWYEYDASANT